MGRKSLLQLAAVLLFTVENDFMQKLKHISQLSKAEKMFEPLRDCL